MNAVQKHQTLLQFGRKLAEIRVRRSMSLREVAAGSRLDPSDIQKYENGKVNPTLTTLVDLARGLGVHPKHLIECEFDFLKAKARRP